MFWHCTSGEAGLRAACHLPALPQDKVCWHWAMPEDGSQAGVTPGHQESLELLPCSQPTLLAACAVSWPRAEWSDHTAVWPVHPWEHPATVSPACPHSQKLVSRHIMPWGSECLVSLLRLTLHAFCCARPGMTAAAAGGGRKPWGQRCSAEQVARCGQGAPQLTLVQEPA